MEMSGGCRYSPWTATSSGRRKAVGKNAISPLPLVEGGRSLSRKEAELIIFIASIYSFRIFLIASTAECGIASCRIASNNISQPSLNWHIFHMRWQHVAVGAIAKIMKQMCVALISSPSWILPLHTATYPSTSYIYIVNQTCQLLHWYNISNLPVIYIIIYLASMCICNKSVYNMYTFSKFACVDWRIAPYAIFVCLHF